MCICSHERRKQETETIEQLLSIVVLGRRKLQKPPVNQVAPKEKS